MGPPWRRRLALRTPAGKPMREMADIERADAPAGGDGSERLENEAPPGDLGMGNHEGARAEPAAAPQRDVEIEHARAPALAGAAPELALDSLQAAQHFRWLEGALHQRDRIGEIAPGISMRGVKDDRRGIEQAKLLVEPRNRRLDYRWRPTVATVRSVRTNGDGVKVGHGLALSLRAERSNPATSAWIASSLRSSQ